MTPVLAKAVLVLLGIAWYAIRYPYERRARRKPVARTERGPREYLLMAISTAGFGLLPLFYICFGFPRSADYTFHPAQAWRPGCPWLARLVSLDASGVGTLLVG